jgi:hypothetical protein
LRCAGADAAVQTHPQLDRKAFSEENVLAPRDPQRPFPLNTAQGVVKWHVQSQDDRLLPLSGACLCPRGHGPLLTGAGLQ